MTPTIVAAKSNFFDRPKVANALDITTRKVLSRFGAFVRTRIRSSMRTRKGPSPAGTPPSAHTKELKNNEFFSFDPNRKSVVIGPVVLNGRGGPGVLKSLEEGGQSIVLRGHRSKKKQVTVTIAARPSAKPAFDIELAAMPALWRDQMR